MLCVIRQIGQRVTDPRLIGSCELSFSLIPAVMTSVDVSLCDEFILYNTDVLTCTIGKKPNAAADYLHDVDEVQEFLDILAKVSTCNQNYCSSVDLRRFYGSNDSLQVNIKNDLFDVKSHHVETNTKTLI